LRQAHPEKLGIGLITEDIKDVRFLIHSRI